MTETTIPLADLLAWLPRTDRETAERLLVGCGFDDGASAEAAAIAFVEWQPSGEVLAVRLAGDRRVLLRRVARDAVIVDRPGAPLAAVIAAARTPEQVAAQRRARDLAKLGVDVRRLADPGAGASILAVAADLDAGRVPVFVMREAAYHALSEAEDGALCRAGARLFLRLFDVCSRTGCAVPDDCRWRLAVLHRRAGELRRAIEVGDCLRSGTMRDPIARKKLATTLAGSCFELWRATGEAGLLRQADDACRLAWAITPGDEMVREVWGPVMRAMEREGLARRGGGAAQSRNDC